MSAAIDALAGLGVLVVDPCDPPDGWIGRADAASVEVWLEVAEAYRQRMGSQSMVAGGSCALQSHAGRVAGVAIGLWLSTLDEGAGSILDLEGAGAWVRIDRGRSVQVGLAPGAPTRSGTADELARVVIAGLDPVVRAAMRAAGVSRRKGWGNVAAACAGMIRRRYRDADSHRRPEIVAAAREFFASASWPFPGLVEVGVIPAPDGSTRLTYSRRTCCLMRLSERGRKCAGCSLLTQEERLARWQAVS